MRDVVLACFLQCPGFWCMLGPHAGDFQDHNKDNWMRCGFKVLADANTMPDALMLQEEGDMMQRLLGLCIAVYIHRLGNMLWHLVGQGLVAALLPGGQG